MPYPTPMRASDLAEAVTFLTRIPIPGPRVPRGAAAAWAWPLAGALAGLCGALPAALALRAGLPPGTAAALALCAQALATGALHEDGLADSADGLWGGATRERRLEIMRDSRIGSYGALALVLSALLRWSALSAILAGGAVWGPLLAAGALSRWPMALMLWALPPAREGGPREGGPREGGLSRLVGRPAPGTLALAGGVALALGLLGAGGAGLAAALAVAALALLWTATVRARLGGQTGDTCGAAQQLGEAAALLALAAAG